MSFDEAAETLQGIVDRLDRTEENGEWGYNRGGHEALECSWSLLDAVREPEPAETIRAFFANCFEEARSSGLLRRYLDAAQRG